MRLSLFHALVLITSFPVAQEPTTVSEVEAVPWTGMGSGSFTGGAVGEIDGDGQPDAVVLRGDDLVLALGVDVFTGLVPVADEVLAVALLGGSPAGIAAAREGGLYVYTVDTESGTPVVSSTLIDSTAWPGAVDLHCVRWNADGCDDLVGLSFDRQTVLVAPGGPAGIGTTQMIPLAHAAAAFAPVQWDLDAQMEILHVDDLDKVRVYDVGNPTPLYTRGNALGRTLVAVLHNGLGDGTDRVALYVGDATGSVGFLTAFDRFGTELAVPFAGEIPHALAGGDVLGDSLPDLAITFDSNADVLIAENVSASSTSSFDPADEDRTFFLDMFGALDLQPFEPANHAPACFGDLDGDARADVLLPSDAAARPVLLKAPFGPLEQSQSTRFVAKGSASICIDDGLLWLEFDFAYADVDPDATQFEIHVFHQPEVGEYVDPEAISMCPLAVQDPYELPYHAALHLPAFGPWDDSNPHVYHLMVRPVDELGRQVDSALLASFALDVAGLAGLTPEEGWENGPDVDFDLEGCVTFLDPVDPVGAFLSPIRLPPLPPSSTPVFADACAVP